MEGEQPHSFASTSRDLKEESSLDSSWCYEDLPGGPSSLEAQPALTDSPASLSSQLALLDDDLAHDEEDQRSQPDDDRDSHLNIMGIADTWPDENNFAAEPQHLSTVDDLGLPCLERSGLGSGALDSMASLAQQPYTTSPAEESMVPLEFFGEEPEPLALLSSGDVKDADSVPGVCGLRNLGNTCFMNAGLQCLVATPAIVDYFLQPSPLRPHEMPIGLSPALPNILASSLTSHFAALLLRMWSGHYSAIQPVELKHTLSLHHPQFKDYRQHDCQEFLALLLDTLNEQLRRGQTLSTATVSTETDGRQSETLDEALQSEAVEPSESSRSSQVSSPRSSESAESHSVFRSQPVPEEVKVMPQFQFAYSTTTELTSLVMEHNVLEATTPTSIVEDLPVSNLTPRGMEKNELATLSSAKTVASPGAGENLQGQPTSSALAGGGGSWVLEDMFKEAKTANVNVAVSDTPINNTLVSDSDKFPKLDYLNSSLKPPEALRNLNLAEYHNFEAKSLQLKRIKKTNVLLRGACSDEKTDGEEDEGNSSCNTVKKIKLEKEENIRLALERMEGLEENTKGGAEGGEQDLGDELANKEWDKYVEGNASVVSSTFQGQFRSTVVCAACQHVSVTYEPFMYLSVPLPKALERQIQVTFVPGGSKAPTKYNLVVNRHDKVFKLKQALSSAAGLEKEADEDIILAEVVNRHIHRILEENMALRYIKDSQRSLYAFQLTPAPVDEVSSKKSCATVTADSNEGWKACAICLDDMADSELRKHTSCTCLLCQNCLDLTCKHYGGNSLVCPVCSATANPEEEFAPLDKIDEYKPKIRYLNVPVVFCMEESSKTSKTTQLTGHPLLLRLPSVLQGATLYKRISQELPVNMGFALHLVDSQGVRCSRCMYPSSCHGCLLAREGTIFLQPGDTLAVRRVVETSANEENKVSSSVKDVENLQSGSTVSSVTTNCFGMESEEASEGQKEALTLNLCLQAFSESENLDEFNPWFCPVCQKNQCATKTLSIWRAPDVLIVYLKRFVFHENSSTKLDNRVEFPLVDLNLGPFISGPSKTSQPRYDLYAAVCHFGGASSGHYTAYTKHPASSEWHYFNDETVLNQKPSSDDYNDAYVLFYKRSGNNSNNNPSGEKMEIGDDGKLPSVMQ